MPRSPRSCAHGSSSPPTVTGSPTTPTQRPTCRSSSAAAAVTATATTATRGSTGRCGKPGCSNAAARRRPVPSGRRSTARSPARPSGCRTPPSAMSTWSPGGCATTSSTRSGVSSPTRPGSGSTGSARPRPSHPARRVERGGPGWPGLPVLDQREPAAAVVEGARGPEVATDGGQTAEDVAAAAGVRPGVHGPVVAGAAQDQDLVVVGRQVDERADRPNRPVSRGDAVEVGPVVAGGRGQVHHLTVAALEALDNGPAAADRAVGLARCPHLTIGHGHGVEHHRGGRGHRGADHRPLLAVPVLDQPLVGGLRAELLAYGPDVVGGDGVHAVEVVTGGAWVGGRNHRPCGAVPVLGQR